MTNKDLIEFNFDDEDMADVIMEGVDAAIDGDEAEIDRLFDDFLHGRELPEFHEEMIVPAFVQKVA